MKKLIGVLGLIAGIALGLYVGVWLMFVGGIVGIVGFIQGMIDGNMDAMLLAWGIVKIIFAGFVGYLSGIILVAPSMFLLGIRGSKSKYK